MDRNCLCFQDAVTADGLIEDRDAFLGRHPHGKTCDRCAQFFEDYSSIEDLYREQKYASDQLPTPDFHRLRVSVWDEIDAVNGSRAWITEILMRPAFLIPVIVIIVAVSLYITLSEPGQSGDSFKSIPYSELIDELPEQDIPERVIRDVFTREMEQEIESYLVETAHYSDLSEIYASDENWDEILATISEMKL